MTDNNAGYEDAWQEPPRPPPRGRGRPRKAVRQEELEDSNPAEDLPLFAEVGETIAKIRVMRVEPNEGFLEDIHDPELTLAEIERRFGGGTFSIQAINERHKICKTTRIKIAGDPVFKTPSMQLQWDRQHGIKRPERDRQELSPIDMITFISEREAIRQDAEMKMQERLKQIQIEADARKRADDDERDRRRRADEDERERRREQQRREDEERTKQNTAQILAMMQASHTQTLQFMQAQMQMQAQQLTAAKPAEGGLLEAIKTIAVIKETFAGDGGGAEKEQPEDLMALLVKNGPSWLNAAGNAIGGAVREIKGGGSAPQLNPVPTQSTNLLAALPEPIAKKMETFVEKLVEKGHDPTVAVNNVLDHLIANTDALPVRGEAAKPVETFAPQAIDVQGIARAEQAQQQPGKVLPMKRNSVEVSAKADGVVQVKFGKKAE